MSYYAPLYQPQSNHEENQPMFAKTSTVFEGHAIALSVAGLILFGTSPNWNDRDGLDKVMDAMAFNNDHWITAAINDSTTFKAGVEALRRAGSEQTKAQWQEYVRKFTAAFLEEHGGIHGLRQLRAAILKAKGEQAVHALHAHGANANKAPVAPDEKEAGPPVVMIVDTDGNIGAQLAEQGAPAELAELLAGILGRA